MSNFSKKDIIEAYVQFTTEFKSEPSMSELADFMDIPEKELTAHYRRPFQIRTGFYLLQIDHYQISTQGLPEFDKLSVGEKFTHLVLTLIDELSNYESFVQQTFSSQDGNILFDTTFERELKKILKQFIDDDTSISSFVYPLLQFPFYDHLLWYIKDAIKSVLIKSSHSFDEITELTDKSASLLNSLLYTAVPDQAADLLKTLYQQGHFNLKKYLS